VRVAFNSLHDACTRLKLKIVRNTFHGNVVAVPLHRRACAGASAFVCGGCTIQVSWAPLGQYICMCVRYTGVF